MPKSPSVKPLDQALVIHDPYGRLLAVGQRVAFNYSGGVRIGQIVDIRPSKKGGKTHGWDNEPYVVIKVRHQNSQAISEVTNRSNLAVI